MDRGGDHARLFLGDRTCCFVVTDVLVFEQNIQPEEIIPIPGSRARVRRLTDV